MKRGDSIMYLCMLSFYISMLDSDEEREDFATFYSEHQGRCLATANAITRNHAWAEEAVQNAFLRMIQHKEKYFTDLRKRTGTLIVIMVKSEALNILRREKRLDHSLLEDVEQFVANDEPDAFSVVAGKEALNRLKYAVSQLDEVSQALYEMKYVLEKTDGEIADIIGMSKNAVAIRLHKIRKGLIEALKKEGYIDV